MKNNSIKYLSLISGLLLTVWALSCSGRPGKVKEESGEEVTAAVKAEDERRLIRMKRPEENSTFKSGDPVNVVRTLFVVCGRLRRSLTTKRVSKQDQIEGA